MIQLRVTNWLECVTWYGDILGLKTLMIDEEGGFALMEAGGAKLAIKARPSADPVVASDSSMVFEVDDLEGERDRLEHLGVEIGTIIENPAEGFRECRFADPEGNAVTIFAWNRPG
jgi:predicted enzyme related to lactoylglutathione lyase